MEERAIYVDIDPNDIHDAEPELLFDSHYRAKQIMLDYGAEPLIKAGSPISASGKVSNNASAIGILKRDCYRHLTSVGDVIIGGYIKSDIAQSHSGIEISDAARAAMSRLAFIGADGVTQPAAGGGGVPDYLQPIIATGTLNMDIGVIEFLDDENVQLINKARDVYLSGQTPDLWVKYTSGPAENCLKMYQVVRTVGSSKLNFLFSGGASLQPYNEGSTWRLEFQQ